ncbi:DUF2867 domain-containing protein [Mesorhizobium sp. M0808]|uniref:DUF2867 domain-containing protein n=1 Tax=Mesorhizobium sp. M0808 TaxID=2957002 RepID=UPI003336B365
MGCLVSRARRAGHGRPAPGLPRGHRRRAPSRHHTRDNDDAVHRNNRLGHLYLAAVMPFHKIIVPALLARLNTTAENVSGPHG